YGEGNDRRPITILAESGGDFRRWLDGQAAPRAAPTGPAAEGERVCLATVCSSCHAIRGTSAAALVGPDLTHVGGRTTLGAGAVRNGDDAMRRWIEDPQSIKPGALMPNVPLTMREF